MIKTIKTAMKEAASAILALRNSAKIYTKSDGSRVTDADFASNEILISALERFYPVCSEERTLPWPMRQALPAFFLLDPLDGTSNFIAGKDDFCISLALIEGKRPSFGLIYDVCADLMLYSHEGLIYENEQALDIKTRPETKHLALVSMRKSQDMRNYSYINKHSLTPLPYGSALKFYKLVKGEAGMYLRHERLSSWDIAAGDFLLNSAKGSMREFDPKLDTACDFISYNEEDFLSKPFIALAP